MPAWTPEWLQRAGERQRGFHAPSGHQPGKRRAEVVDFGVQAASPEDPVRPVEPGFAVRGERDEVLGVARANRGGVCALCKAFGGVFAEGLEHREAVAAAGDERLGLQLGERV